MKLTMLTMQEVTAVLFEPVSPNLGFETRNLFAPSNDQGAIRLIEIDPAEASS